MLEQIKVLIIMYMPTVLMAISTIINYVKIFKGLKQKDLREELENTQKLLKQQMAENEEIKQLNKELINEISRVKKYDI